MRLEAAQKRLQRALDVKLDQIAIQLYEVLFRRLVSVDWKEIVGHFAK